MLESWIWRRLSSIGHLPRNNLQRGHRTIGGNPSHRGIVLINHVYDSGAIHSDANGHVEVGLLSNASRRAGNSRQTSQRADEPRWRYFPNDMVTRVGNVDIAGSIN